ncbi:MAG: Capsule biosynthesis protein CapA [Acidimicrobiales bacterium AG-410-I20]|nr:MAG: Capsule biosynthesis protein CapA [Acidimicrobiales bacterium AG-410-I20]
MTPNSPIPNNERRFVWGVSQLVILGALLVLVFSFRGSDEKNENKETEATSSIETSVSAPADTTLTEGNNVRSFTLAVSGEILVHEFVADAARSSDGNSWNFEYMFDSVKQIFEPADLSLCHLETPLSGDNSELSYYPNFEVPYQLADAISSAQYDGCSVASNHSLDAGITGVTNTLTQLNRAGVQATGMSSTAEAPKASFFEVDGISIVHFSVTDTLNNAELPTDPIWLIAGLNTERIISNAEGSRLEGADFIVVSVHWGEEYISTLSTHQEETVIELLDSEHIDLVIGHGTHVPQSIIFHNEKYGIAGLGNFLSNQPGDERRRCNECPPATQDGMIAWLEIEENENGKFLIVEASYYPTWVDRSTYEIILLGLSDTSELDSEALSASANRTAEVVEPILSRSDSLPE